MIGKNLGTKSDVIAGDFICLVLLTDRIPLARLMLAYVTRPHARAWGLAIRQTNSLCAIFSVMYKR